MLRDDPRGHREDADRDSAARDREALLRHGGLRHQDPRHGGCGGAVQGSAAATDGRGAHDWHPVRSIRAGQEAYRRTITASQAATIGCCSE